MSYNPFVDALTNLTDPVEPDNGGTGITDPGPDGNVLTSDGTDWVSEPGGGTGLPSGGTVDQFVRNTAPGEGEWADLTTADRADLGAAASGINNDITEITGLTRKSVV